MVDSENVSELVDLLQNEAKLFKKLKFIYNVSNSFFRKLER